MTEYGQHLMDPNNPKLPELQAAAAKGEAPASVVFQAESLRGMLLTTYALDHMGDLGATATTVLFICAAVLLLLATPATAAASVGDGASSLCSADRCRPDV